MSRVVSAFVLTLFLAAPAFAKDICFADNAGIFGNRYVFTGVKVPAKGKTAAISGLFIGGAGTKFAAIQGSLYRRKADGKFLIGIVVHSSLQDTNDFTATWEGDAFTFAGTAKIDADGTATSEASLILSAKPCKEITVP